ncbi:MAG TPA: hypothetical protein VGI45_18915, partial [Terracidiphilus sp.]
MVESEQASVFGSVRENFLALFSGLYGIGIKPDANGGVIKLYGIDVHKIAAEQQRFSSILENVERMARSVSVSRLRSKARKKLR